MCDDCSIDNTYKIAKSYEDKYPKKIKVLRNNINRTLAPTLNNCLKFTTGKYIARQDGDDRSDINRLKRQVKFLEENKDIDLVGTAVIYFDDNGEKSRKILDESPSLEKMFKTGCPFIHPSIMIKSDVIKALKGYSEKKYAIQQEDYELWGRFFYEGYKAKNLNEYLYYYREDNDAYKRRTKKRRLRGIILSINMKRDFKMPLKSYLYLIKDVMFLFIPKIVIKKYYESRL